MSNATVDRAKATPPELSSELGLQAALDAMDLELEAELLRYRQGDDTYAAFAEYLDLEAAEYEEIPPSQPFDSLDDLKTADLTLQRAASQYERRSQRGGDLTVRHGRSNETLNLDITQPGDIAELPEAYRDSARQLWHSARVPDSVATPPNLEPEKVSRKWISPRWTIAASTLIMATGAAVYSAVSPQWWTTIASNNINPVAVSPLPPPGELLIGPDLAAGELSDLTLSSITQIQLPSPTPPPVASTSPEAAVNPDPAAGNNPPANNPFDSGSINPNSLQPVNPASLGTAPNNPNNPGTTANKPPAGQLSNGLIRSLLPPNIQRLAQPPR
jgi:hypothetical protein